MIKNNQDTNASMRNVQNWDAGLSGGYKVCIGNKPEM